MSGVQESSAGPLALGIDTGGTFTDLVALGADGSVRVAKAPSTPDAPLGALEIEVCNAGTPTWPGELGRGRRGVPGPVSARHHGGSGLGPDRGLRRLLLGAVSRRRHPLRLLHRRTKIDTQASPAGQYLSSFGPGIMNRPPPIAPEKEDAEYGLVARRPFNSPERSRHRIPTRLLVPCHQHRSGFVDVVGKYRSGVENVSDRSRRSVLRVRPIPLARVPAPRRRLALPGRFPMPHATAVQIDGNLDHALQHSDFHHVLSLREALRKPGPRLDPLRAAATLTSLLVGRSNHCPFPPFPYGRLTTGDGKCITPLQSDDGLDNSKRTAGGYDDRSPPQVQWS